MAAIAPTNTKASGLQTVVTTTLTAADTLVYNSAKSPILQLRNSTASPVVVTIDGSTATTVSVPNTSTTVDISAGKAITVPASGFVQIRLIDISAYLVGTIAVTGGVGVVAALLEF